MYKKLIFFALFMSMTSCQYFPQFADAIEDIATDEAIIIEIDRAAFQKETDIDINVIVKNKGLAAL